MPTFRTDPQSAGPVTDRKTAIIAELIRNRFARAPTRILVVGCGTGREAAQLARSFRARVVGIDLEPQFDTVAACEAQLQRGDATALDFPDSAFDFIYSYHALEHIPDYRRALAEMRRVLAPDGGYCIGTPNRQRVIGYLGSVNADWRDKIRWNALDWSARLRGRFRNEYGAHAGFTRRELRDELTAGLGPAQDVTLPYYTSLYARRATLVRRLEATGLAKHLLPSVYFVGKRLAHDTVSALAPPNSRSGRPSGPSRSVRQQPDARPVPAGGAPSHQPEDEPERS
jgi:SAM-dependent methyltransferase